MTPVMNFYRVFIPTHRVNDEFADANPQGAWGPPCKICHRGKLQRQSPLRVQWVVDEEPPGRDTIADFTWMGYVGVVVTQRVRDYLEGRVTGAKFGPVVMLDDPTLHRPKRMTKRTRRRVWMPYEGPPLWELIVPKVGIVDRKRSKLGDYDVCPGCGRKLREKSKVGRLVVRRKDWPGVDFFQLAEWKLFFVTEHAKAILKAGRFTNLSIRRRGEIVD
jgi:hypothetical protein